MTAFMLACYLNGTLSGAIYFESVNDCTYYTKYLSGQVFESETGKKQIYKCICKLVPSVNPDKVKVY